MTLAIVNPVSSAQRLSLHYFRTNIGSNLVQLIANQTSCSIWRDTAPQRGTRDTPTEKRPSSGLSILGVASREWVLDCFLPHNFSLAMFFRGLE